MCTEEIWKPNPVKTDALGLFLGEYRQKKRLYGEKVGNLGPEYARELQIPDGDDLFAEN